MRSCQGKAGEYLLLYRSLLESYQPQLRCHPASPAESSLHVRRSSPYTAASLRWAQTVKHIRQGEKICRAEQRPPSRHHHEGVRFFHVGPACRQRADTLVTRLSEEHPVLPPRMGEADQLELLTPQRVERVSDTEPLPIAATPSS